MNPIQFVSTPKHLSENVYECVGSTFAKWSGKSSPPPTGTVVTVTMDGWLRRSGRIAGYRVDHGWLMACVYIPERPEWHRKQEPNRDTCVFAGCELEWETANG